MHVHVHEGQYRRPGQGPHLHAATACAWRLHCITFLLVDTACAWRHYCITLLLAATACAWCHYFITHSQSCYCLRLMVPSPLPCSCYTPLTWPLSLCYSPLTWPLPASAAGRH